MPPKSSRRPSRPPTQAAPALRLDDHVGYLLRCAWQRSAGNLGAVIEPLTPTQYAVLMRLLEHGELSQNRLGRLTAMERGNISDLVVRLSDAGVLATRGDPNDRRLLLVSLTRDGRRMAERALAASIGAHERLLAPLDAAERRTLVALLRKLIETEGDTAEPPEAPPATRAKPTRRR